MNKKTRDDVIEALLLEANSTTSDDHYSEFCDSSKAQDLAKSAFWAVEDSLDSNVASVDWHEMGCLEAAQLLIEGWNPGDKVVKL